MTKIIKILFVMFIVLLGLGGVGVFLFPQPLVKAALKTAGYSNISFENIDIKPGGLHLRNVSVAPFASVEEVTASWSLPAIFTGKIKTGAFKNAVTVIPTAAGLIPVTLNGTVEPREDTYQINATLASDSSVALMNGTLTGTVNPATASAKLSLEIMDSKISLPDLDVKRLAGWLSFEGTLESLQNALSAGTLPLVNGQLTAGNININGLPLQATTLSLSSSDHKIESVLNADVAAKSGNLSLNVKVDASKPDIDTISGVLQGNLKNLDALGRKDLAGNGDINLTFSMSKKKDIAWNNAAGWSHMKIKGDAAVQNLSLADVLTDTSGKVGISTRLDPSQTDISKTSADILIKSFGGKIKDTVFSDVNSVLHIDRLMPLVFKNQKISIGLLNAGLPLTNGLIDISLDSKKNLTLNNAVWDIAKGRISASPFSLPLNAPVAETTLTAEKLDLIELFKLAPMDGLDATGTVNGTIPLKIGNGTVAIVDGVLETTGPGAIRYNPQEIPAFLKDNANQQIIDLRVALKAFEFESLKLILNGEIGKNQKISLQAKGKNPEFYEGHPVNINFNVEGPLDNVLKYSPGGSQIPDNIQKQIESYEKEHANP